MHSFLVRIYRWGPAAGSDPVGTVERVETGVRSGFQGRDQLLALLAREAGCDDGARADTPSSTHPTSSRDCVAGTLNQDGEQS